MILVTKNNVSAELLKKIIGERQVSEKFLLQTSKGIHTTEIHSRSRTSAVYMVKHIYNSPYAVIHKGRGSTYISGSIAKLVCRIKNEDYDFYIRKVGR